MFNTERENVFFFLSMPTVKSGGHLTLVGFILSPVLSHSFAMNVFPCLPLPPPAPTFISFFTISFRDA